MADLVSFDNLRAVLERYAKEAEEIYKYQIALGRHNASRKLADTVAATVEAGDKKFEVKLKLQKYWKYLEGGSQGTESSPPGAKYPAHFPPPSAIEQWISVKPVIPRPGDNGKIPTPKQLSYAISKNIEKFGQKPFPALETTKEELRKMFEEDIAKALLEDMKYYVLNVMAGK